MTCKLEKKDLEKKFIPSKDLIVDASASNSTMAAPSGSQLKEKRRKRLAKVPAEPQIHKQARVMESSVPLALTTGIKGSVETGIAGNVPSSKVPSVGLAPTMVDVHFRPCMIDDEVWSSLGVDRTRIAKLRKEDMVELALTLMKEVKQAVISDGMDKLIKESEEDKLVIENEDLKRKLEVAHIAQDKLKKEVLDLNTKQEKWRMEKIDLESALKEERDLHKSTQVNLTDEKKRLQEVLSDADHQYLEGFKCAKSQAAFLCSVDEGKLNAMRLWGQVRDGEIVVDDEGEESESSDG